jgi:transcriptional regulator with XRE-family HTH domain
VPGHPQQAREALGGRLREIRQDAGLTARALAMLAGWHFTKVSKLEHGTRRPSRGDIAAWCRYCGAEDQLADLLAAARGIDAMYTEWRRQMRAGMKYFQDSLRPLYEQTLLFRVYETTFVPSLLSTAEYATAMLEFWAGLMSLPADIQTAVAARMDRQNVLYAGKRRFLFLMEEQALRTRAGGAEVMAGQLGRLLALMSLPRISVGIIPAAGDRGALAQGSFWIFDDARVHVETVSAGLDITQPAEISLYAQVFGLLQRSAVYGQGARDLIERALGDLRNE